MVVHQAVVAKDRNSSEPLQQPLCSLRKDLLANAGSPANQGFRWAAAPGALVKLVSNVPRDVASIISLCRLLQPEKQQLQKAFPAIWGISVLGFIPLLQAVSAISH